MIFVLATKKLQLRKKEFGNYLRIFLLNNHGILKNFEICLLVVSLFVSLKILGKDY